MKQCEQTGGKNRRNILNAAALEKRLNKTARAGADGLKLISGEMGVCKRYVLVTVYSV